MPGDPKECRLHAAECFRAADNATNPKTQEEFTELARIWLRLAAEFESNDTLLKTWGDFRTKTSRAA